MQSFMTIIIIKDYQHIYFKICWSELLLKLIALFCNKVAMGAQAFQSVLVIITWVGLEILLVKATCFYCWHYRGTPIESEWIA